MAQTGPDATGDDSTDSTTDDLSVREHVDSVTERLESLERDEVSDMDDLPLVELRMALKNLEDVAEETRKDQTDDVLEDRIDPGEDLFGLQRVESHRKYVEDDVGSVIMSAVSQGIDYTQFTDINASDLADVAPEIAEIGRYEYTYFR